MTWAHLLNGNKTSFGVQLLEQIEHKNDEKVKLTLQVAKDLRSAVDDSGYSLLHYAAKFGNETVTSYLIELGAKINVENKDGDTPLSLATKEKNAEIIKILLKSDADIYICNKNAESAVKIALQSSPIDFKIAKLFLQQVSNDCSSDITEITDMLMKINCPLYVAVLLENVDVTKFMLSVGCAIDGKDPTSGKTALHVAVENADLKHVEKLVFLGADVEAKDASGKTPLGLLSNFSKSDEALSIVNVLLKEKADLTSCDNDGFMQMRSVIQNGTDKAVEKVLQSSCDITMADQNKQNIIHYSASNCNLGIVELIFNQKKELSNIAHEHFCIDKFDLNARDKFGLTALHNAMNVGNKNFVRLLIKKGVNVHILSNDGVCPLLQAVQSTIQGRLEQRVYCVTTLLRSNAQSDIFMGHYFKIHDSESAIDRDYALLEPVVAVLAAWKATERPFHQGILKKVHSHPKLKRLFEACTIELEKMKGEKVGWNMTVFEMLNDNRYSRYSMSFLFSGWWAKRVIRKYQSIPFYYEFLDDLVCEVMRKKTVEMHGIMNKIFFLIVVIGILLLVIFLWFLTPLVTKTFNSLHY